MINYTPPTSINASGGAGGASLNGIDIVTSIQLLLVQDYDNQLQDMGKQIKGTMKCKQKYREEIQKLQTLLTKQSTKFQDDHDNKKLRGKEAIPMTKQEEETINKNIFEYIPDPKTGEPIPHKTTELGQLEGSYKKGNKGEYYVPKEQIEKLIENLQLKLNTLNEQSELLSLNLQSLTNQRKIAFETISNLVNKQHEGLASITRNIKS